MVGVAGLVEEDFDLLPVPTGFSVDAAVPDAVALEVTVLVGALLVRVVAAVLGRLGVWTGVPGRASEVTTGGSVAGVVRWPRSQTGSKTSRPPRAMRPARPPGVRSKGVRVAIAGTFRSAAFESVAGSGRAGRFRMNVTGRAIALAMIGAGLVSVFGAALRRPNEKARGMLGFSWASGFTALGRLGKLRPRFLGVADVVSGNTLSVGVWSRKRVPRLSDVSVTLGSSDGSSIRVGVAESGIGDTSDSVGFRTRAGGGVLAITR